MPRLRYKKDYDVNFEESENERSSTSGQSWLSNATIVAQLSDKKIHEAITHYRALISLLEAELLARSYIAKHVVEQYSAENFGNFNKKSGLGQETTRDYGRNEVPKRRRNSTVYQFQALAAL